MPKPPLAGRRILVVDNDPAVAALLEAALGLHGAEVRTAASAEEALARLARDERCDLVVLDLRMPGLGGLGFLERLDRAVPVLVCSGFVAGEDRRVLEGHDCVRGILEKPFDIEELAGAARRALGCTAGRRDDERPPAAGGGLFGSGAEG